MTQRFTSESSEPRVDPEGGLRGADLIAFVPASNLSRARSFYEGTLGLRLQSDSAFACVFSVGRTVLRVTAVDRVARGRYTVLGWSVPDIAAAARDLAGRGVRFLRFQGFEQDELGVWTAPDGDRVAWFKDPDGNMLSLTQYVTVPRT